MPVPPRPHRHDHDGESSGVTRRTFFAGGGVLAAAGAAVVAALPAAASSAPEPDADGRGPVYRETDHIRSFYQRARF